MAKTDFQSVDAYLAAMPDGTRAALETVRRVLRKALPGAVEAISYQIPAFKLPGGGTLYFAGWRDHISLYPFTVGVAAALEKAIAPYRASKGTLRFPLDKRPPVKPIAAIAKVYAAEMAAQSAAKKAARKKEAKKPEPRLAEP